MIEKCCGACAFNKCEWKRYNVPDFFCGNVESEYYGCDIEYSDYCIDWEEKDE